jgi:hypothetical protein
LKGISIAVAPSRMIELTSTGRVNGDFRPFLPTPPSFGGGDPLVTVASSDQPVSGAGRTT